VLKFKSDELALRLARSTGVLESGICLERFLYNRFGNQYQRFGYNWDVNDRLPVDVIDRNGRNMFDIKYGLNWSTRSNREQRECGAFVFVKKHRYREPRNMFYMQCIFTKEPTEAQQHAVEIFFDVARNNLRMEGYSRG
jgi:hypothetical protein